MFKRFIERPVLSTVISIIITMLGVLGLVELPIEQYPNIAPPTVRVSANYAGANADVVLKSVIIPLEEQINGVEGMTYMTSSATNDGGGSINVFFKVGTDPNMAAVEVQNRVSSAAGILPAEVTRAGVSVRKQQSGMLLITAIYSDNPAYDQIFLQNYADINIIPKLKRVNGVGGASAFGSMTYSMRIWLKPDVMAVYGITAEDITSALNDQSIEAAPGSFGENGDQSFQYVIRYTGKLRTAEEFGNIIVRSEGNGKFLRLKDVARVELGAQDYSSNMLVNGKPTTNVAVSQTPGSNAREVIKESLKVMDECAKDF
ncbi:MAG TPA: efflux RND transporter permease subunit, partial [Bacteroidales bacterium]|nr:efflux RND transporter permease subunit [Bacteroidales bacterium]